MTRVDRASPRDDFALAAGLFRAYADGLGIDLRFQGFAGELASLAQMYGPPSGCLLLARDDDEGRQAVGCAALRRLDAATGEMKRMDVRPSKRWRSVGRRLALAILEAARDLSWARVRLEPLPTMREAQPLYRSLGFVEVAPYYPYPVSPNLVSPNPVSPNPVPGARYLGVRVLRHSAALGAEWRATSRHPTLPLSCGRERAGSAGYPRAGRPTVRL